jgi:hypothetical protein
LAIADLRHELSKFIEISTGGKTLPLPAPPRLRRIAKPGA